MATLAEIIADVALMTPYSTVTYTDATLIGWMNQSIAENWRWMASTAEYMFTQTSGVSDYAMSTSMTFDRIKYVGISDSTVDTSTCEFTPYTLAGIDDALDGSKYYKARGSTIGDIGLYPVPTTSGYYMKIIHEVKPPVYSTSDSTTSPNINNEYHDLLKFHCCEKLAMSGLSGKNPNPDLFNLYNGLKRNYLSDIKMNYYQRKQKNPKTKVSYSDGWFVG